MESNSTAQKNGRGDLLIMVSDVGNAWSGEHIHVYVDSNGDVGGPNPLLADAGFMGDGYEIEVVLEGAKTAFASLVPGVPNVVQIAVSRALLDGASEFTWGAWAEKGVNEPHWFDYNDHFNPVQAGSPIKGNPNYPLAGLYSVDNTCRQAFGFIPQQHIPGTCITAQETKQTSFFCCPSQQNFGCCSMPELEITPTPVDGSTPGNCVPSIPHISAGECSIETSAQVSCDDGRNVVTIAVPGEGYSASLSGFDCTTANGNLVCTGPKQEPGSKLVIEVCGSAGLVKVPNCKNFPNSFWSEELGACLTLGSSCCPIGQEWTTDEGKCVPIVNSSVACGGAYTLINGVCVLKSSLSQCCVTLTADGLCCYTSCAPGYKLNAGTQCCDRDPCAGVNCSACCNPVTGGPPYCPEGCCSCR